MKGSLVISIFFGKRIIDLLRRQQIGETVRDLGLTGQVEKQGTPTMGGLIILGAILIPTLLFVHQNSTSSNLNVKSYHSQTV